MQLAENQHLGAISKGASYPIAMFQRLSGLSTFAMRAARRNGLRVRHVGRRLFVTGDDWHAWLDQLQEAEASDV